MGVCSTIDNGPVIVNCGLYIDEMAVCPNNTDVDMANSLYQFKTCLHIVICCIIHEEVCGWVLSRKRWLRGCLDDVGIGL